MSIGKSESKAQLSTSNTAVANYPSGCDERLVCVRVCVCVVGVLRVSGLLAAPRVT